jgi:membrane protein insertase Oxa1/YidC/SpoIIIJ
MASSCGRGARWIANRRNALRLLRPYHQVDVRYFGNFGVAILLITVVIKLVFFQLANKSYAQVAKMSALCLRFGRKIDTP